MADADDDTQATESLERFSEIIIETLRELSSRRQPLSTASLQEALAQRQDVLKLLGGRTEHLTSQDAPPSPLPTSQNNHHAERVKELRTQMRSLQGEKDRALEQMALLEQHGSKVHELHKRVFVTMLALIPTSHNEALAESLEQYKQLLMASPDLDLLEQSLQSVKDIILKEGLEPRPQSAKGKGFFGRWLGGRDEVEDRGFPRDEYARKIQDNYLEILHEFHLNLGSEYLERYSKVEQAIRKAADIDQVLSLNGDILPFIQSYARHISEERSQVTDFCAEIGANLAEMEKHFLASITLSSEAHKAGSSFDSTLENQMEEIKTSARLSVSLGEFKGLVVNKLATIKSALDNKRKEDDLRLQEINRQMESLQQNLHSMKAEIDVVQERTKALEIETLMDPLTGIHNLRAYKARIKEELERFRRYQQVFSLLIFDVDHFKRVNDRYGHHAGDKCLQEIIKRIRPILRASDFFARYGGEEFTVILPGTDRDMAFSVAEKVCRTIHKTRFMFQGTEIPLTISVGVTQAEPTDVGEEAIFARADKAVYEAKGQGRNRAILL